MLRPYTTRLRQKSHVQQRCHSTAAYAQTVPELLFCFWQAYGNDRTQAYCPSLVHERSHKQQTACDPRGKTLSISALVRFYPYWKSKSIFPLRPRLTARRRHEKPYFYGCQRPARSAPLITCLPAPYGQPEPSVSEPAGSTDRPPAQCPNNNCPLCRACYKKAMAQKNEPLR